ncbi:MAG: HAD-IB family phosphatase [Candidatus Thermoplasmatota archaeon]|jgi:phosphoserine phosphatase|nr:HAD-IB family phosphatase [Candidatus Thermoplasmatota archaeon]MCL5794367.1 HAD-IB family phosphatase [Candidatus Thermoplasmatota archaeon]
MAGKIRLVLWDMDGVLTEHPSSWKYIHERIGVDNSINRDSWLDGRITYREFMQKDIQLWLDKVGQFTKNQVTEMLSHIRERFNVSPAIEELKRNGIKSVIVSGGISWLADILNSGLIFDMVYANEILADANGNIIPDGIPHVIPDRKDIIIRGVQESLGISLEESASVGDSPFDISMFRQSGTRIAFNPRESSISEAADYVITSNDLYSVVERILALA